MVGKVTTEGVRAMSSDAARLLFELDGSGITIGVISDSFNVLNGAPADILSGDLPGAGNPNGYVTPVTVLKEGSTSATDEGRAMLQIIHDVAPGAELLFHEGVESGSLDEDGFVQAINALANAGADVIVDDVSLIQPLFQDGPAAQAINNITNQGVAYFSAQGNTSNLSYESPFRPGETITIKGQQYLAHDFDPGAGVDIRQNITFKETPLPVPFNPYIQWNQPFDQPTTELDLFLFDQAGNLLRGPSTDDDGYDDKAISLLSEPYTAAPSQPDQVVSLVIGKPIASTGPNPSLIKWKDQQEGRMYSIEYATNSSTLDGQVNAAGAISVGASDIRTSPAFGRTGPLLQSFSSLGGTPILFDSAGTPLPQPEIRQKPEIVGPNGVSTTVPGNLATFFGTSAAAPHLAAVAALMLQRAGGADSLTPAQVRTILQQTALTMDSQPNFTTGAGFVQADQAVLQAALNQETGNDQANTIRGTKQPDNLFGLAGNDQLRGFGGKDALFGAAGHDQLWGGVSDDYLTGDSGRDTLVGEAGVDLLVGGRGADLLTGGAGVDVFLFSENRPFSAECPEVDTITDFKRNENIALDASTFTTFLNPASSPDAKNPVEIVPFGSNPSFSVVQTTEQAQQSAAAIIYNHRTGAIYYNANGAEAGFGTGGKFAEIGSGLELSATNFEIVEYM